MTLSYGRDYPEVADDVDQLGLVRPLRPADPYDDVPPPDEPTGGWNADERAELQAQQPELAERVFEHEVAAEVRKLRAREEAKRIFRREGRTTERPRFVIGTDFLDEPDPPISYRLDDLWPTGGRVLLAAQYKAGKTTLLGNLIRSLTDVEPFLGRFNVGQQARRVALIDDELDRNMLRRWLRDQGIQRTDLFAPVSLRGKLSTFDILDPEVRSEWAEDLRALDADVVVLDCLRPVLDALGLDENREAGRLLTAFDELLGEAGVSEAIVVHHMGHSGERSRGDSRLRDWPDVEWRLVREDENAASPRYFSAFGRDVDVAEALLTYDSTQRRLTLAGGNRRESAARGVLQSVLDLLAEAPQEGLSGREIEKQLTEAGEKQKTVREAVQLAKNEGLLVTYAGARRATMHVLKRD